MCDLHPEDIQTTLKQNLDEVTDRIGRACDRVGRTPDEVRLVAVTKYIGPEIARCLLDLGVSDLGENRWQVAKPKLTALSNMPVCWHWIGHLQTNKAKRVLSSFHVIHSMDRLHLLEEIDRILERKQNESGKRVPVYLQVNVSGEEPKIGTVPEEAERLGEALLKSSNIDWLGLMTMAPHFEDPEKTRPIFAGLRELRDRISERLGVSLPRLSMGMSNDFEVAIEEGATDLRIGTVLYKGILE